MRSIHSLLKAIAKPFTSSEQQDVFTGFYDVTEEMSLPDSMLNTINSISSERLWNWTGEYYSIPSDPDAKEIIMYTSDGSLMKVHINNNGELKSIHPKEGMNYYRHPELMLAGRNIIIRSYNYSYLKRLVQ